MPRSVQFSRSSTIDDQASRSAASIPCIGQTPGMQDATADDLVHLHRHGLAVTRRTFPNDLHSRLRVLPKPSSMSRQNPPQRAFCRHHCPARSEPLIHAHLRILSQWRGSDGKGRLLNHLPLMLSWSLRNARLCVLVRGCRRRLSFRRRGYKRCKSTGCRHQLKFRILNHGILKISPSHSRLRQHSVIRGPGPRWGGTFRMPLSVVLANDAPCRVAPTYSGEHAIPPL